MRQDEPDTRPILLCLSHLRWSFVTQRPQHLLTRAARDYRVIYWEEPHYGGPDTIPGLHVEVDESCTATQSANSPVTVVAPVLAWEDDEIALDRAQREILDAYLDTLGVPVSIAWFYTPMAMGFAGHVTAETTVYDCMDELSAFDGASPRLQLLERRLLRRADLVFTGGRSLQAARQHLHPAVHCFPSAVDCKHFAQARRPHGAEPADQASIPHPRIGFFGVLDERLDGALVEAVADARPDWHLVLLGPLAKIDADELPNRPNIHWLGPKTYAELPDYLRHWDAGLMPFARNAATRYISPTKTPEFLAAGVKLVSTPVPDVVASWSSIVAIADGPADIVAALQSVLRRPHAAWLAEVDRMLAGLSWDECWAGMQALVEDDEADQMTVAGD